MEKLLIYNSLAILLIITGFVIALTKHKDYNYRITGASISFVGIFMIVSFVLYVIYIVYLKPDPNPTKRNIRELKEKKNEDPENLYTDPYIDDNTYLEVDTGNYEAV